MGWRLLEDRTAKFIAIYSVEGMMAEVHEALEGENFESCRTRQVGG